MIKQSTKYGCGMYAVANACNMPDFVTPDRLEASKGGIVSASYQSGYRMTDTLFTSMCCIVICTKTQEGSRIGWTS